MPSDNAEAFLKALAQLMSAKRAELGISQDQLARISGIDRATISRLERVERVPSIMALYDLAAALEIPLFRLVEAASEKAVPKRR